VRVAVILPELDPHSGGGFTFQQALLEELRRVAPGSAHEFVFYVRGRATGRDMRELRMSRRAVLARTAVRAVRDVQDRWLVLPRVVRLRTRLERAVARDAIDVVWFTTPYAEDCDRPFIFTIWDLEYLDLPWYPEVSRDGEWERRHAHYSRFLPKATRVIVPNASGAEQVRRHFGLRADRLLELPHPTPSFAVDGADGDRSVHDRHAIEAPYLLYPAQFWPHKDHRTLLRALALLPEHRLVLVGSDKGAVSHVRADAARLGVADRVQILGFVSLDELVALYRGADALVYVSLFGPENLPPLEAMALGCPVIAADVPGAAEQLGDGALRIAPHDHEALASAVRSLADGALRERLVRSGRARAGKLRADGYVRGVLDFLDDFDPIRPRWEDA
jgi:glycosyltransferase involved in cell wall biosynthesis